MKKYRIEYDRESCLGAAPCTEEDPKNWKISDVDGKADLKDSKQTKNSNFVKEITEKELPLYMKAAESCPVNVIHIIDIETGEELI